MPTDNPPKPILADGIPVQCAHTKIAPLDSLKPNPRNPNKHPKRQIKILARVIKSAGWRSAIVVSDRSGLIVKGHGRYEAAKLARWESVPIDIQHYESESAEHADLLADNQLAEGSTTDKKEVAELLKELEDDPDFDELDAGFEFEDIGKLLDKLEEQEENEPVNTTIVYQAIVQCTDEKHQQAVLKELADQGYKVTGAKAKLEP